MLQEKVGRDDPANIQTVSLSQSGNTGGSHTNDIDTMGIKDKGEIHPQYSIHQPFAPCYATTPVDGHDWLTPEEEHTDDAPWCREMKCQCHFQQWRMERFFIAPIEHHVLDIAEAIDLYHGEPGYMARKQAEAMERERGVLV